MTIIRLKREFDFEMAHTLTGYDGPCRQIHGHSYKLFITVGGTPNLKVQSPKFGMVMDFGDLKRIVNELIISRYDHALLLRDGALRVELVSELRAVGHKIELTPYQPTCENMVISFVEMLRKNLPETVELFEVELFETARSSASWRKKDNE
ncbi:MAG: 6-carboxytetrahydropterin synthase [Mucinivorans sp.]